METLQSQNDGPKAVEKELLRKRIEAEFLEMRNFLDHYAEDGSFSIECGDDKDLDTFAVDLEKKVLYYSTRYWAEKGFEPRFALKSTLHECEHMRELEELIRNGGTKIWKRHKAKLDKDEAYRIADNCYDDVKMDASVEMRAPVAKGTSKELCEKKQFVDKDFTKLPKHLQFAYALKRDLITGENSLLSSDVREEFDNLKKLLHLFSRPETPMADRIDFQEKYIEPLIKRLKEEDEKNPEFENKSGESDDSGEDKENKNGKTGKFDKHYKQFWDNNPAPVDMPKEKLEELVKQMIEAEKDRSKSLGERAFESYAKKEGVEPKDLEEYRSWKKREVDTIVDKETGMSGLEKLREQIDRIVKMRIRDKRIPIFPQEEGDVLVLPADAYVESRAGVPKPQVWEEIDTRRKEEKVVSNFDLHIVCDTSGSMDDGVKLKEQRKATMLLLEAMQELYERLKLEQENIAEPLSVRTECLTFGSDVTYLKNLAPNLTEKDRVAMYKELNEAPGSTADYKAVRAIVDALDTKTKVEMKEGKRLKLVIVMTDGGSDNPAELKKELQRLRDTGAVVVGVAITNSAKSAIEVYAPDKELAEEAGDLPNVFERILDKQLETL